MKAKKYVGFLLWLLLCALSLTPFFAQAVRSSGAWQELTEQTAAINGTPPQADSVTIPVYQGSVQLRSDAANPVARQAGRRWAIPIYLNQPRAAACIAAWMRIPGNKTAPLSWQAQQVMRRVWSNVLRVWRYLYTLNNSSCRKAASERISGSLLK
ncbi:TPA: hypothetical protein N2D06_001456 [Salmonella enterica]|nr:hypothetical protein [Salmonella enterica]HCB5015058.1 hypothetical protein [Salmonella enterica subsp. enterica serovar Hull]EHP3172328.1 hypothetical protein [Salmonella enterica]HCL4441251.1 hypothetical protein [Salmonella enterica]HCL4793251.1 hypothetical protein [Salmonella enterica]HCL5168923.1 hypothetical protein [Salmonella enterica]